MKTKGKAWHLVVTVLLILAFVYTAFFGVSAKYGDVTTTYIKGAKDIRFGVDIKGGVNVTFVPSEDYDATEEQLEAAQLVIENRLVALNVTDYELYVDPSSDSLILEFPWQSGETDFDPEAAIDEAATVFVQAQSMYAKGDQKSAVSLCEEALGKSMDAELNAQIYLLEAELYLEQGDINSAADAAAQAVKLDESSNVLRKAAVTAYQAGNEERIGTVKNQWYRQALAYYEMLCQKNDPSYEDRLGRALLLRVLGKYRDSTDVLEEMKIDYPKDYKVQMWICYNYLDEASEEGTYSNVSGDLKFTYHSCRNLYENRADRSEEDPDMEMLEETMKELE